MAGAPEGNQNSTRERRMLNATLKRYLVQNPEDAVKIIEKLITAAKAGEPWAVKEVFDRESGKPTQPISGDDDMPPIQVSKVERVILRANATDPNG